MPGLPRWSLAALLAITVLGGVLRFESAGDPSTYQSRDEVAYAMIARAIVNNHTYGLYGGSDGQRDPVHWPPGAPALFALAFALDDHVRGDGRWDVPAAYTWQAAVGTLTIVATFALVVLVAGPLPALLAASFVALYPPLIDASGDLLSEPLGILLLLGALIATVLTLRRRSWKAGVLAGVLLAGTVLTRADLLLLPLIVLVTVGVVGASRATGRRAAGALRTIGPMVIALVVVLTPWTIFASGVSGHFVPLTSGGASNLWVGTYLPGHGSIFGSKHAMEAEVKKLYPRLRDHQPNQISQVHVIRAVAARHPDLTQEAALRKEVLVNLRTYALGQPLAFGGMMAEKVWRLWGRYTQGTYTHQRGWILAIHLVIVGFGFAGLIAGLVFARRAELWMIAALLVYVSLMNAVLVSEPRHNLVLMPVVVAGGAIGFALAFARLRAWADARAGQRGSRTPSPLALDSPRAPSGR